MNLAAVLALVAVVLVPTAALMIWETIDEQRGIRADEQLCNKLAAGRQLPADTSAGIRDAELTWILAAWVRQVRADEPPAGLASADEIDGLVAEWRRALWGEP